MEGSHAGPYSLTAHVWSYIQRPVPGAACVGNARSSDRGWGCCVCGTGVGGGTGVIRVCAGYGEGILLGEERGVLSEEFKVSWGNLGLMRIFMHATVNSQRKLIQTA